MSDILSDAVRDAFPDPETGSAFGFTTPEILMAINKSLQDLNDTLSLLRKDLNGDSVRAPNPFLSAACSLSDIAANTPK